MKLILHKCVSMHSDGETFGEFTSIQTLWAANASVHPANEGHLVWMQSAFPMNPSGPVISKYVLWSIILG